MPTKREEVDKLLSQVGPVEVARRFYVLSWQGRGLNSATARIRAGWRFVRKDDGMYPPDDFYNVDDILAAAHRLSHVQLENDDVKEVIKRYDTPKTLFYLDPPYLHGGERTVVKGYANEFSHLMHRDLCDIANRSSGMFIVSGYKSSLYTDIYKGWRKIEKVARDDQGNSKTECLWLSANIKELQIDMFRGVYEPAEPSQ
jgi:DNA adenine methylase